MSDPFGHDPTWASGWNDSNYGGGWDASTTGPAKVDTKPGGGYSVTHNTGTDSSVGNSHGDGGNGNGFQALDPNPGFLKPLPTMTEIAGERPPLTPQLILRAGILGIGAVAAGTIVDDITGMTADTCQTGAYGLCGGSNQYVVRGGVANAKQLQEGTRSGINGYGYSVQTAPGLGPAELAKGGKFPNKQISVTSVGALQSLPGVVVRFPTPGFGLEYTKLCLSCTSQCQILIH
jgi:hypothetical protein